VAERVILSVVLRIEVDADKAAHDGTADTHPVALELVRALSPKHGPDDVFRPGDRAPIPGIGDIRTVTAFPYRPRFACSPGRLGGARG
jgi:hypothetical protein